MTAAEVVLDYRRYASELLDAAQIHQRAGRPLTARKCRFWAKRVLRAAEAEVRDPQPVKA